MMMMFAWKIYMKFSKRSVAIYIYKKWGIWNLSLKVAEFGIIVVYIVYVFWYTYWICGADDNLFAIPREDFVVSMGDWVYVSLVMNFTRKFVNVCNVFESANAVLKHIEYTALAFNKSRKEIRIFGWFRL